MKTFGIKLVRVSDSLTIQGTVAEGPNGPMLALGSEPYSAAVAGRRGRITIPSFHAGSRQLIEQEPGHYFSSVAWDASRPGRVRTIPQITRTLLNATYPTNNENARGAIFQHPDDSTIVITPQEIYEEGVLVDSAPADTRFTGSYAIFGDYTFFGVESELVASYINGGTHITRARDSATVFARWRTSTAGGINYGGNASFAAGYLCVVGQKLFRCVTNIAAPRAVLSWTDETGTANPTFSTGYTYPTAKWPMDMAQLGPHAVIALGGFDSVDGEVIIVDASGNFSNLIPPGSGLPSPLQFIPYQGGQILAVSGPVARSIFLADAQNISPLPFAQSSIKLPFIAVTAGAAGFFAASELDLLVMGAADAMAPIYGHLDRDGSLRSLEMGSYGTGSAVTGKVLAARIVNSSNGDRYLEFVRVENTNDLYVYQQPLWSGTDIVDGAATIVGVGNSFVTPAYHDGSWGLKQFLSVAGYGAWYQVDLTDPTDETITVAPTIDGGGAATSDVLTVAQAAGGWQVNLDETAIGRALALTFSMQNSGDKQNFYELICPIIIDYLEIPNQNDVVNVTLLAGSIQMTRGGTLSKQSRLEILDNISSALQNPSRWTLTWWDGRADWTVVPIKYTSQEVEDAARPGEGAALVTIVLQRLFTDPTVAGG